MEGREYFCGWVYEGDNYRCWVHSNPRVAGKGATINQAREALSKAVMRHYGDGEPIFEFQPPLPTSALAGTESKPKWVALICRESVNGWIGDGRGLVFDRGFCSECGLARGQRTDAPLKVEEIPGGVHGLDVFCASRNNAMCCGFSRQAYSEAFLGLLSPGELALFDWREIVPHRRSRRRFKELIERRVVPYVTKQGVNCWTWGCDKCGGQAGIFDSPEYLHLPHFISATSIPEGAVALTAGFSDSVYLCLPEQRWRELARKPECKGVMGMPVVVLEGGEVGPSPTCYSIEVFEALSELQTQFWERYRDELLASPEVKEMQANPKLSDDDVWDYIHARVDERLAFPVLYRDHYLTANEAETAQPRTFRACDS